MAQNELNAPSTRMGRVLDDFDALDGAYDELAARFAEAAPSAFIKASPKPVPEAVLNERARRQYTLGKVRAARHRQRVARMSEPEATAERVTRGGESPVLTEEEIVKAIDEASALPSGD